MKSITKVSEFSDFIEGAYAIIGSRVGHGIFAKNYPQELIGLPVARYFPGDFKDRQELLGYFKLVIKALGVNLVEVDYSTLAPENDVEFQIEFSGQPWFVHIAEREGHLRFDAVCQRTLRGPGVLYECEPEESKDSHLSSIDVMVHMLYQIDPSPLHRFFLFKGGNPENNDEVAEVIAFVKTLREKDPSIGPDQIDLEWSKHKGAK